MLHPPSMDHSAFEYYPRLRRLRSYVEENLSEPIPLKVAAEVVGLEATYFSKYFRARTGVRFKDWITYERINRAVDLIRSEDVSLTRVAVSVGFQSLSSFDRAFKRCCGMTPSDFKRQVRTGGSPPHSRSEANDDKNC